MLSRWLEMPYRAKILCATLSGRLREGYGLVLYPEGTRSPDGTVGPFRRGIGRLIATFPGMPVIPVRLSGSARAMPKGAVFPGLIKSRSGLASRSISRLDPTTARAGKPPPMPSAAAVLELEAS